MAVARYCQVIVALLSRYCRVNVSLLARYCCFYVVLLSPYCGIVALLSHHCRALVVVARHCSIIVSLLSRYRRLKSLRIPVTQCPCQPDQVASEKVCNIFVKQLSKYIVFNVFWVMVLATSRALRKNIKDARTLWKNMPSIPGSAQNAVQPRRAKWRRRRVRNSGAAVIVQKNV